ncbi:MAG: response regulator, partial [Acidobacteriota bacterium]
SMRKVIRKVLTASGFLIGEYMEASNGREALDVLEENWIDLILSDIHMPVMDGIQFIRTLREKADWSDLPVVFITTEANEDRIREVMELGAKGYIRKPFKPEEIRSLLANVMGETTDDDGGRVAVSDEGCDF